MSLDLSALPRDVDALQAMAQELASALTAEKLHADQLKALIAQLRCMQFGRSAEKIDLEIAQLELALDEHCEDEGTREASGPVARLSKPQQHAFQLFVTSFRMTN